MKTKIITFLFVLSTFYSLIGQDQRTASNSIGLNLLTDLSIANKELMRDKSGLVDQLKIGYGIGIEINHKFKNQFYLGIGLNFSNRRFGSIGHLNQSAIPEPKRSLTQELVTIKRLSYQIIEIPFKAGIVFFQKGQQEYSGYVIASPNFILSGNYKNSFSRYDGLYNRSGLNGFTNLVGVQGKYKLQKKLSLKYGLEYSVFNSIEKDDYISNNGDREIAVDHNFFRLVLGVVLDFE